MSYVEVSNGQRFESSLSPLTTEEAARAWQEGLRLVQPSIFSALWRWVKRG